MKYFPLFLIVAALLMWPSVLKMTTQTDSYNYMSIAENVAHGRGFVNQDGKVELVHPFGYSLAMVPFIWLGLTARWAAFMVNLLSVMVVGMMAWLMLRKLAGIAGWRLAAGTLLVTVNAPLMLFANQVLTEAMDAALVMVFCWLVSRARSNWRHVLFSVLCGLALWFTRYQSLAIIVGAGLFLRTWRDRAVVILPPLALAVLGYLFVPAMRPLLVPRGTMASNVLNVPIGLSVAASSGIGLGLLICLVRLGRTLPLVRILAGAVVTYAISLLVLVILKHFDPLLDVRLFVPITAPLLALLVGLTMRYSPRLIGPGVLLGLAIQFGVFMKTVVCR